MALENEELLKYNCELLKAMAHPVRLCILKQLSEGPKTCCVGELDCCTSVSQSSVSQHLAKLREMEVVAYHREGNMLHYFISNDKVGDLIKVLFS